MGGGSISVNAVTSPDGTTNADKLVENASLTTHSVNQSVTKAASAITYTGSCYIKAAGRNFCRFAIGDATLTNYVYASIDLSQVTISSTVVGTGWTVGATSIASAGGGWYRVGITVTSGTETTIQSRFYASDSPGSVFYTGDGTSGLFLYQAQLEAGTGASSPIPTTTASVTRAADVAAVTGLSMPYPLSMVSTFQRDIDTGASQQTIAQVDTGAPANRFNLYISSADLLTSLGRGGVNGGDASVAGATVAGVTYTGAARALQNSFIAARSGTLSTLDSAFDYPATAARLGIGNADSSNQLNGTISRIRIYNRALSNAELQAITT